MKQNAYCQTLCRKTYTAKQMEEFQVGTLVQLLIMLMNARAILGACMEKHKNVRINLRAQVRGMQKKGAETCKQVAKYEAGCNERFKKV